MRQFSEKAAYLLRAYPLGCSCLLFAALTASLLRAPSILKTVLAALAVLLFILFLLLRRRAAKKLFLTAAAVFCAVLLLSLSVCAVGYDLTKKKGADLAASGTEVLIKGYPEKELSRSPFSSSYLFRLREVDGRRVFGVSVVVSYDGDRELPLFSFCEGSASFRPVADDDPSFDATSYYLGKGVFAECADPSLSASGKKAVVPARAVHALRTAVESYISGVLREDAEGFLRVILLGDKKGLAPTLRRDLRFLGLSHLLAVSGMHLSVLYAFLSFLLKKLRAPKVLRLMLLTLAVLLYMALCAFTLSVLRAGIMLMLLLAGELLGEKQNGMTSLCAAGALILFFSPFSAYDVGFLMSFAATFGILAANAALSRGEDEKSGKTLPYLLRLLLVSVAAQIAVLPVAIFVYGGYSPLAPVFTVLLSPLFAALMYTMPFLLLFLRVPYLSALVCAVFENLYRLFALASSSARFFKELCLGVSTAGAVLFSLSSALLLFLLIFSRKRKRVLALAAGAYLLFACAFFLVPRLTPARVILSTYKNNDLVLCSSRGKSLVIDLSDGSGKCLSAEARIIREKFLDRSPDVLVLTHFHTRHLKTFASFADSFYPETLCLPLPDPGNQTETDLFNALSALAEARGVRVLAYDGDDVFSTCGVTISSCRRQDLPRSTHPVISFDLTLSGSTVRYLSSSAHEVFPANGSDCLYCGVPGPVFKTPPDASFSSAPSFFASPQTKELFGVTAENAALPPGFVFLEDPFGQ